MDDRRFDLLARALAAASTRRAALAGLLAALGPAAVGGQEQERGRAHGEGGGPTAEACVPSGQRCGTGGGKTRTPCRRCCSRYAIRERAGIRRCSCRPDGFRAGSSAQCCTGVLGAAGYCGACAAGLTRCRTSCVDFQTDPANCSGCGVACGAGEICRGGACMPCGERGESCCPGGACDGDLTCRANGTCGLPPSTCNPDAPVCDLQVTDCTNGLCRCARTVEGEVFCRGSVNEQEFCGPNGECPDDKFCIEFCRDGVRSRLCAPRC